MDDKLIRESKVMIVDDDPISLTLLSQILKKDGYTNITSLTDSRKAEQVYDHLKPELVILDLNMPHVSGLDIIKLLKSKNKGDYLPILILTSSDDKESRQKSLDSGAKDFVNKPYDTKEVLSRSRNIIEVRLLNQQIKNNNLVLEQKVHERTQELFDTQMDLIDRLSRAMEFRDTETGMHILRMSHYSDCLAKSIGLSSKECEIILTASPLHDIGKIGIPDSILLKPGKLTPDEFDIMKTHTTIGGKLLGGSKSYFLEVAHDIALNHHEKWDGTGYPQKLTGIQIPLSGRICCITDVFDALTSKRPYKEPWPLDKTLEELKKGKGTHFDPVLVDKFLEIIPEIIKIKDQYEDN
ncbi:MAG: response regulator [Candidatus Omnitrophica bacterium]|nr:response regulator [Candidatus Omnitrophota bacterium]